MKLYSFCVYNKLMQGAKEEHGCFKNIEDAQFVRDEILYASGHYEVCGVGESDERAYPITHRWEGSRKDGFVLMTTDKKAVEAKLEKLISEVKMVISQELFGVVVDQKIVELGYQLAKTLHNFKEEN